MTSMNKKVKKSSAKALPGNIAKRFKVQRKKVAAEDKRWEEVAEKKKRDDETKALVKKRKSNTEDENVPTNSYSSDSQISTGVVNVVDRSSAITIKYVEVEDDVELEEISSEAALQLIKSNRKKLKKTNKGQLSNNRS
jgi:adenylate kinase family enzyme